MYSNCWQKAQISSLTKDTYILILQESAMNLLITAPPCLRCTGWAVWGVCHSDTQRKGVLRKNQNCNENINSARKFIVCLSSPQLTPPLPHASPSSSLTSNPLALPYRNLYLLLLILLLCLLPINTCLLYLLTR